MHPKVVPYYARYQSANLCSNSKEMMPYIMYLRYDLALFFKAPLFLYIARVGAVPSYYLLSNSLSLVSGVVCCVHRGGHRGNLMG